MSAMILACTQTQVEVVEVSEVSVIPQRFELVVSEQTPLQVELRGREGDLLVDRDVSWTSLDESVAQIDASGVVTATGVGTALIQAEVDASVGTTTVLVDAPPDIPGDPPLDAPRKPSNLDADEKGESRIDLEWDDRSDDESRFEVQRRMDGEPWVLITTVGRDVESYRDDGLEEDTRYEYRVRACNEAGCSRHSKKASAKTDD